jgi:triacylglycerol lipase
MLQIIKACANALCALRLLASCLAGAAQAANNDPVVLVHGFLGFGPDAFPASGFLYWGGYTDIAAHMQRYRGAARRARRRRRPHQFQLGPRRRAVRPDQGRLHRLRRHPRGAPRLPRPVRQPPGKCWAADAAEQSARLSACAVSAMGCARTRST